jgi:uncharacterized protein YdcH (DUF465 family)
MPTVSRDVRQELLNSNPEYQRLALEHTRCENLLEELKNDRYLNVERLNELAQVKKIKLRLKDEMERIVAEYTRGAKH